eukprot:TRINITY_DN107641_c0_g1_i1.p1 TRINITY_DN107641_c0_g1~~TRINITY_DN107641_c0_g1_i1.p1  ORF type:complete len:557 (-),score=95.87 TRINITY_DN107641_c0_g1_i1:91-1671(-)
MDANSFHAAVRDGSGSWLPPLSSLTFQGIFNQHSYNTGGPELKDEVAIEAHATRGPDSEEFVWTGCFLKCRRDGQPRDEVPIDMVVVLDISGSMRGKVSHQGEHSRLQLATGALSQLLPQLRPDDRFGLATFTHEGRVVQPLARVQDLNQGELLARIGDLRAGGGTTLAAGMQAALDICEGSAKVESKRHRRLLFLTDMNDLQPGMLDAMIGEQAQQGLYVSFLGIGMEFNAQLAEEVSKHPGSNYFCITRDEEMRQTIVDKFDWNFFPVAFDVEVTAQSDFLDLVSVYGTPFDAQDELIEAEWLPSTHKFYPSSFKLQAKTLALCANRIVNQPLPMPAWQNILSFVSSGVRTVIKVDTVFPSGVDADGAVEGGLVLLRFRGRSQAARAGTIKLTLRYTADGVESTRCQELCIPAANDRPGLNPELLDSCVRKGVLLQRYVQACRDHLAIHESRHEEWTKRSRDVKASLATVDALLMEMDDAAAETDKLCPGVREELRSFSQVARSNAEDEGILERDAGCQKNGHP